ncbi:hypothetical protein GIB67_001463 [Kingdonia uniflora]|uniref:DUF659 domain-containing protein n=1 Tax=Kingdonia uniflora TaxID=39325 RepID=A0A7J7L6U5_9MAGN|nr:hypothetical protein GIB67_001463 [Kingdonia uniflora]
MVYIADFFYENSISFNCARSDSYSKMQAIVQYNDPSTFKPPSYNDLSVKKKKKKKMKKKKKKKKKEETSNWGRTLINFLVNYPKGTVFLKSIDGSAHIHDAKLIYKILKDVIEEVEEKNVIQMERILDRRWSGMLQKPLYAAAHYLNPQYYYATLTSSDEIEPNTKLKEGLLDCITKLALDEEDESQILRDLIVYRTKAGRLGKRGAQACVKTIALVEWWIIFGSEVPALQRFAKRIHTKKRNCLEHDRMRDLAYIQYNKRLKKRYEERISGKEINPIVLKSLDKCAKWLVPDDARDDIVLGTAITYGVLEDAEDGFDDPPLTRTSRTNTTSHCLQGGASSSQSTTCHLQDSSDDDDYDVDKNYDVGDGDDDGIDSGSDEDI